MAWAREREGHASVCALLAAGADVAQAWDTGGSALIAASGQGHLECVRVRVLLEAGADVAQAISSLQGHLERDGWTALMAASLQGHLECVRALRACRAISSACARCSRPARM